MTDPTPLDAAHAAMAAAPDDDAARLRWWGEVAASMLYVLLDDDGDGDGDGDGEGDGDAAAPRVLTVEGVDYVLAFDTEERLAAFAEAPVARAEMPGRVVAEWLAGQPRAGLALNLGAPSGQLLPPEALAWLAAMLAATGAGDDAEAPAEVAAPGPLPAALLPALERAL
ncbi:MAG: SseB family protein, partial [Rhodobacteraceae bacterium]|nr:SseB family protein [Paracoccaceae bacterium]